MKIKLLCLGRLNKEIENELCERYLKRTNILKNSGISDLTINHLNIENLKKRLNSSKEKSFFFELSEKGKSYSTHDFVQKLNYLITNSFKYCFFIIGKPDGSKENLIKADEKICLSKMTFTHSLSRVILVEQIYRCATIMINHPYHK